MHNYKLVIEYDGADFAGWQIQPDQRTVQGELQGALRVIAGEQIKLSGASRTDAGVHALGQVANFKTNKKLHPLRILKGVNALSGDDVQVVDVSLVDPEFHARFSAKGKTYRYHILNRQAPSAIYRNRCWHIPFSLDILPMSKAAEFLIGVHDFSSFQASACDAPSPVREINQVNIRREEDFIIIDITANAFLNKMARNIVGALVQAGAGKIPPEGIKELLEKKDRTVAPPTAPATGLTLLEVHY